MSKIGVMTAYNDLYAPLAQVAVPVMDAYCRRHGYVMLVGEYHDRPGESSRMSRGDLCKAAMYQQYYHDFDVLMWLDVDSIIMNHDKLIDLIPTMLGEFVWSYDINGPLSGWWVAKCIPMVRQWIYRFAFNCAYEDGGGDQHAMQIIAQRPPFNRFMKTCYAGKEVGHCYDYDLMGYPQDLKYVNHYEPGDWIITFPGMALDERLRHMKDYAGRVQCDS